MKTKGKSNNKIFLLLFSTAIIFISSIKWKTGTDWPAYASIFEHAGSTKIFNEHLEPLYVIIIKILRSLSDNFSFYVVFMSITTIGIKVYALMQLRYPIVGVLLFIFSFQFNVFNVRYDLALSFVLLFLVLNNNRKPLHMFHYLIAAGIHKIAILAMVFEFIRIKPSTFRDKIIKFIFFIAVVFAIYYMISQASFLYKLQANVFDASLSGNISIKIIHRLWYFLLIVVLFFISYPDVHDKYIMYYLISGSIFYCAIGVFNFGSIERVMGLFFIYEMYYLANIKMMYRRVYISTFILTVGFVRAYQFFSSDYSDLYFPYETIIETRFKNVY